MKFFIVLNLYYGTVFFYSHFNLYKKPVVALQVIIYVSEKQSFCVNHSRKWMPDENQLYLFQPQAVNYSGFCLLVSVF